MGLKLSEENPTQHLAILVIGGIFTFLNLLDAFSSSPPASSDSHSVMPNYTYSVDEASGEVQASATKWSNPQMSWLERYLCRGYQRASWCSFRLLHPMSTDFESVGMEIEEAPPSSDHVIRYRGKLEKNTAFTDRLAIPDSNRVDER